MKNLRGWQIVLIVCTLIYMGWMIYVGYFEFTRINGQYSKIVEQLEEDNLRSTALAELTRDCRRRNPTFSDLECSSWPVSTVKEKESKISDRITDAKNRAIVKMVMFYMVFLFIFLIAPPLMVYLLILAIIKIYQEVKIVS